MYFIKLFIYLAFFFLLLFIILQNSVDRVNLYFFNLTFEQIHLFWIMFFSFLAGAFFAWLITVYQEIVYRFKIFRQKREIENLKKEVHNLRKMIVEEPETPEVKDRENTKEEDVSD